MSSEYEHLEELLHLARCQCDDGQLVAGAQVLYDLAPATAAQLVERHADRLEAERVYGQAELHERQFVLARDHFMTQAGAAMLVHLGVQHLGQVPGGPDRELQRLLRKLRRMSPQEQAIALRSALGRMESAA